MADDKQRRIRERAYELWERDGRPEGKHDEHWRQAAREVEGEGQRAPEEATVATSAGAPREPGAGREAAGSAGSGAASKPRAKPAQPASAAEPSTEKTVRSRKK